ncbi:MAG: hypothetical protein RR048_02530 [Oscillospiraceae bacterium]
MDGIMDRIFDFLLGGTLKFVTNKEKNKTARIATFAFVTVLYFVAMFLLLMLATKFNNIFIWVALITGSLILLSVVFTFIKKFLDERK